MSTIDHDQLVTAARAGDRAAFQRLVEDLHPDLRIFVAVRCSNAELTEEVVQAALITAWRLLARYEARGTFSAWVKGIALNHLRKELSTRARRTHTTLDALDQTLASDDLADLDEDPRAERLRACLDRLERRARELVELRYRDELDLETLAERLGRPAGTLAVMLHRVRKALRDCLAPAEGRA